MDIHNWGGMGHLSMLNSLTEHHNQHTLTILESSTLWPKGFSLFLVKCSSVTLVIWMRMNN